MIVLLVVKSKPLNRFLWNNLRTIPEIKSACHARITLKQSSSSLTEESLWLSGRASERKSGERGLLRTSFEGQRICLLPFRSSSFPQWATCFECFVLTALPCTTQAKKKKSKQRQNGNNIIDYSKRTTKHLWIKFHHLQSNNFHTLIKGLNFESVGWVCQIVVNFLTRKICFVKSIQTSVAIDKQAMDKNIHRSSTFGIKLYWSNAIYSIIFKENAICVQVK